MTRFSVRTKSKWKYQLMGIGSLRFFQNRMKFTLWVILIIIIAHVLVACGDDSSNLVISRADYQDRLRAFWLSQSIANWTGLQTEGRRTQIPYYTDEDWDSFGFVLDHVMQTLTV